MWAVLRLNTRDLYDLQRIVSRLASDKRLADPEWQQRRKMGLLAAGYKDAA